jgi:hypothetical protein
MTGTQVLVTLFVAVLVGGIAWFIRSNNRKSTSTGTGSGGGRPGKKQK